MTTLTTGLWTVPTEILTPWMGKMAGKSTIAALTTQEPIIFGGGESVSFTTGEAELVEEGAPKSETNVTITKMHTQRIKLQVTVRVTDELELSEMEQKRRVFERILTELERPLGRGLDLAVYHGVNPATGLRSASLDGLRIDSNNGGSVHRPPVEKPYVSLDAAKAIVLANGYVPSAVALGTKYAGDFSGLRSAQTEQLLYPGFSMSEVGTIDGLRSAVSDTVQKYSETATLINAYVGDFSAIRWGIVAEMGVKRIEYGDPDGRGDLQRENKVAYRAEVIYAVGVEDSGRSIVRVLGGPVLPTDG